MSTYIKLAPTLQELRSAPELKPVSMDIEITQPAHYERDLEALTQHMNETARVMRDGFEFLIYADPVALRAFASMLESPLSRNGMYLLNRRGRNRLVWGKRCHRT